MTQVGELRRPTLSPAASHPLSLHLLLACQTQEVDSAFALLDLAVEQGRPAHEAITNLLLHLDGGGRIPSDEDEWAVLAARL